MQEIANRFKEEYTELLSRYKEQLTNAQIMSVLQSVTKKQIGFKDNPERLRWQPDELDEWIKEMRTKSEIKGLDYAKGFPIVDELEDIKKIDNELKNCKKDSAMYRMLKAKKFTMLFGGKWRSEEARRIYRCSPQETAEADCCGDIYKCKNACGKLKMNTTTISDYQGAERCTD